MTERTIWWEGDAVAVLDQTALPAAEQVVRWRGLEDAARGIADMQVRGAPLIGVAAAHGLALALSADPTSLDAAIQRLAGTRPTAVNLRWALDRAARELSAIPPRDRAAAARTLSEQVTAEDIAACAAIGLAGVGLLEAVRQRTGNPVQVLTHCNAGWLACVAHGTATAPIYLAHDRGIEVHVWVSETRPRNQGSALTAWELGHHGVPHTVIVDNAAGHLMRTGQVDLVITGADRIAADGDVANKVGTYLKAVAARDCGVPFYVAAPTSTFDPACPDGDAIPIEERDPDEVLRFHGQRTAPAGSPARNWAFDVTPARLVDGYITDRGLLDRGSLDRVLAPDGPIGGT